MSAIKNILMDSKIKFIPPNLSDTRIFAEVKRFEDDRGIVTIYFDKLINQKTCMSFTVTRENIVDRLEPANVKLYDYYQQELTISSVSLRVHCFIIH